MEPAILFTPPPNLEELCGITVLVKLSLQTPLTTAQLHITKCREMIFTEPELIASPSFDVNDCFNIIMLQSHFKTGKVQTRLQKQGLQLSKPYRVMPSLYQSCLYYTILARLAPIWNRAGEWLIQGRDFLVHTGYTNAIKMQLCVNKDEMFVSVIGTVVKFPPLQVEDLDLSREEMQDIVKSTEDHIREVTISDCWCYVLPSMKRGRIISLSLNISRKSPFTSYRDLQRHWKNMYGYRLPDTDLDILYCQVGFLPSNGGKHFTYPSVCLRSGPLHLIQRVDPKPVLTAFMQDIHSRVGTVCGHLLRFQPKLCFAYPSLHAAGAAQETRRMGLSSKPVNKPAAPLRSQKSMLHLYKSKHSDKKTTIRENLSEQKVNMVTEKTTEIHPTDVARQNTRVVNKLITQLNTGGSPGKDLLAQTREPCTKDNIVDTDNVKLSGQGYSTTEKRFNPTSSHTDGTLCRPPSSLSQTKTTKPACKELTNSQSVAATKFVPHFKPKLKQQSDKQCSDQASSNCKDSISSSFIPVFKPHANKINHLSNSKKTTKTHYSHEISEIKQISSSSKLFTADKDTSDRVTPQNISQHSVSVSVPHFRKQSKHKGAHKHESSILKLPDPSANSNFKLPTGRTVQQSPSGFSKSLAHSPGPCLQTGNSGNNSFTPSSANVSLMFKTSVTPKLSQVKTLDTDQRSTDGGSMDRTHCDVKRKKLTEGECTPKKSRVKPQIHADLDVESLARVNQLGKVNAVTLTMWLKERGVICRSKDKKTDLVEKVNNYIMTAKLKQ